MNVKLATLLSLIRTCCYSIWFPTNACESMNRYEYMKMDTVYEFCFCRSVCLWFSLSSLSLSIPLFMLVTFSSPFLFVSMYLSLSWSV